MEKVYKRADALFSNGVSGFCPGCMHSTVHKLIGQVLDELGQKDNAVCVYGIGCCGLGRPYLDVSCFTGAHGRACASATGVKRSNPEKLVYTYQGDGDGASIGIAETVYAANRGEKFTMFFINNGTYGMTGGQMAPTTLVGQKATTAPFGRKSEEAGYPLHLTELLNTLKAPVYLTRVTCNNVANIRKARAAIKKALEYQLAGKGFAFVEFVSNCPTNWGMSPLETLKYMEEKTLKEFPLGEVRAQ